MMPYITAECKKCHGRAIFDTGRLSRKAVEDWMAQSTFGECAAGGWHVEIGSKANYYDLDWSISFKTVEEARAYNRAKLTARQKSVVSPDKQLRKGEPAC